MNQFTSIFLYSIICFFIIYLVHYIFNYLKDNFTKPIIKDFVHAPKAEYDKITSIISNSINKKNYSSETTKDTPINMTSENNETNEINDMQDELKQFMQNELNA